MENKQMIDSIALVSNSNSQQSFLGLFVSLAC